MPLNMYFFLFVYLLNFTIDRTKDANKKRALLSTLLSVIVEQIFPIHFVLNQKSTWTISI